MNIHESGLPMDVQEYVRSFEDWSDMAMKVGEGAISAFCSGGDCILEERDEAEGVVRLIDTKQATETSPGRLIETWPMHEIDELRAQLQDGRISPVDFLGTLGLIGVEGNIEEDFTIEELNAYIAGKFVGQFEPDPAIKPDVYQDANVYERMGIAA